MKRGSTGIVCWLCLAALACEGTDSQLSTTSRPTLIRLDPETFLGEMPCSPEPGSSTGGAAGAANDASEGGAAGARDTNEGGAAGAGNDANSTDKALKTYVATLFDLGIIDSSTGGSDAGGSASEAEGPKQVSSPIASCWQGVVFGQPATTAAESRILIPGHSYEARIEGYTRSAEELEQRTLGAPELFDAETRDLVKPAWTANCTPVTAINQETNSIVSCDALKAPE